MFALLALIALSVQQARAPEIVTDKWPNGSPRFEREVVTDAHGAQINEGAYRSWHENGQLASEGRFAKGLRSGDWQEWHSNGHLASKGRYAKDRREGRWSFWRDDGSEDLLNSGLYRYVALDHDDGTRSHEGYELDGKRHGRWTFLWKDGRAQFEGEYRSGLRLGEWVFWNLDGSPSALLLSGVYEGGKRIERLSRERIERLRNKATIQPRTPATAELERVRAAPELDMAEFPHPRERRREAIELLRALDLGSKRDREIADLMCGWLTGRCNFHGFGWPAELAVRSTDRGEAVRAWASLLALVEDDPLFWDFDTRADCGLLVDFPRHSDLCPIICLPPVRRDERAMPAEPSNDIALYALRSSSKRGARPAPGSPVAKAIDAALAWLVAHQRAWGGWDCDKFCEQGACSGPGEEWYDTGVTALALLALTGNGNSPLAGTHRDAVTRGILFLVEQQNSSSGLLLERRSVLGVYDHAIATLALAEVYALCPHPYLRQSLERAVGALLAARNSHAAWRYAMPPDGDNDTSVTAWAVSALHAARVAGIEVPQAAFDHALRFLDEVTDDIGRCGYTEIGSPSARVPGVNEHFPFEHAEALTAAAMFCQRMLGRAPGKGSVLERQSALLLDKPPKWDPVGRGTDFYYWFWGAQAMQQMDDKRAGTWSKALERAALAGQCQNGCAKGSFDPVDPWSFAGGRVYSTAMVALALEASYRCARVAEASSKRR